MKRYRMQLIFGLPILLFAMTMIALDVAGVVNVANFGYAFFGGIIALFVNYFFRKSPPEVDEDCEDE
jgi:ABC-type uncharacterized transport system permease subunit